MTVVPRAVGTPLDRLDGPDKVRGTAIYAFEQPVDRPAYLYPLQAAIATGRVTAVDAEAARAEPGVLAVLTHLDAPRLASADDAELAVLQTDEIAYRGQLIGGVIAETAETARHAAQLVRVDYAERPHHVELDPDSDDLYKPLDAAAFCTGGGELQDGSPADSATGDVDAALAAAEVRLDATYSTPMNHHNPMEPHTAVAVWTGGELTVHCSTQGASMSRDLMASVLGLGPSELRVVSPHVGGAFGSKVYCHSYAVLAAMAARLVHRPVKFTLTRRQMFSLVGCRPATVQRVRLGADASGRLTAIAHDVVVQTARVKGYAEHVAVCSRYMYAAPNRRTTHRLAPLDLPVPTIMRAPGEAQGMFALESAMDEMADACGLDPVEFRIRNEPAVAPETGLPFSSRHLVACLRDGARRFGWQRRNPTSRSRRDRQGWLVGTGVAASSYPSPRFPGNAATIRVGPDGHYTVLIAAADIGTGTWTALTQIAADALGVTVEDVHVRIGDSALPHASPAGMSSGVNSWGTSVVEAAERLRALVESEHGGFVPPEGLEVTADMPANPYAARYAMYSFGAQFAEVRVHADTGEVRVPRLLGVFDVGRVINPGTARSQLLGGMTMGLSMALFEQSVVDPRFGHVVNQDLAMYHIASNVDVGSLEAYWVEAEDPYTNPMGAKGIGEICVVGTAAAIANAVHHATGVRVRDLPITLDKLLNQVGAGQSWNGSGTSW
ncbi:xanthine dehydrogenase family protein molybdopterin-binding subunit [Streptomyces sp. NPDC004675]|uniref:xanthine dehydrogenase family protein molybdopterin-binding subunit n=1 Tax=Streptomyces sp. NPDC004675 TaxID=3154286 RepID=UPI0033B13571